MLRLEPRALVQIAVEALVGRGVGNVDGVAGAEYVARDAEMGLETDLFKPFAPDQRPQLAGLAVMQEQGRSFGAQECGHRVHDLHQQRLQAELSGQCGRDLEDLQLLGPRLLDLLVQDRVDEGRGRLGVQGAKQLQVLRPEVAFFLVQHLDRAHDPGRPLASVSQGHTHEVACSEARLLVDLRVEAGIGVGVVDHQGLPGLEHRAHDPALAGDADLRGQANPRLGEQLVGLRIVEEDRAALRVQKLRDQLHHSRQQDVEGKRIAHPP